MKTPLVLALVLCLFAVPAIAQIVAGSAEEKAFQQLQSESNADVRLQKLSEFEKTYPKSRALPNIYLMVIDFYREKNDPDKIIEYAEKALKIDEGNVTAMMALSRNYAIKRVNLDRAVELAQKAVDQLGKMRAGPPPTSYSDTQWKAYLDNTEAAAKSILTYTRSVRGN
jgi:tetratricopeptide (TPR) repeat protein